jgi:hypothetical protein
MSVLSACIIIISVIFIGVVFMCIGVVAVECFISLHNEKHDYRRWNDNDDRREL